MIASDIHKEGRSDWESANGSHEIEEFKIPRGVRNASSRVTTLDFR